METKPTHPPNSPRTSVGSRVHYAILGVVATGVALAASEVVAGLFLSAPSLIRTIGQRIIDITPAAVEDWAISTFGTNDKAVLIAGIVVVSLAIGALLGMLARERLRLAVSGFVAFGLVGFVVGLSDPLSTTMLTLVAGVVAAGAGVGILLGLRSLLERESMPGTDSPAPDEVGAESRRAFVRASVSAAFLAVVGVALGRFLADRESSAIRGRDQVTLPSASGSSPTTAASSASGASPTQPTTAVTTTTSAAGEPVAETPVQETATTTRPAAEGGVSGVPDPVPAQVAPVEGVSELITPNSDFYRIDTALSIPRVDVDTWKLSFRGSVDNPFEVTYDELLQMPLVERYVTLCCVSNPVGGSLVGNAKWLGVPLRSLVEQAGVRSEGTQLIGRSVDGFTVGFPTSAVFDGREALVAVGMNGEPLPLEHGFPARLVVSGLYGYVSATKWLSEIEFTGWEDFDAYWIPRGWAKQAPIKTQSRIDTPRAGAITTGSQVIAGVAWAQNRGIERVEVQVGEGPWMDANLPEELTIDTWRQWYLEYDFPSGVHVISVRATDATGETQPAEMQGARPDGATGYHMVSVNAS